MGQLFDNSQQSQEKYDSDLAAAAFGKQIGQRKINKKEWSYKVNARASQEGEKNNWWCTFV
jgi:hypothetical protein